jgi:hypothetical protein
VLFDAGARRLLARAYAKPGEWVMTRLADPTPGEAARCLAWYGINVLGPDNAPTQSGRRQDAHTRWGRGFVRALYYQHKWWSGLGSSGWRASKRTTPRTAGALQVEWGRRLPVLGVIPAGRAVRVRLARGGQAAAKAVAAKGEGARIYDARGNPAGRHAEASERDW